MPHYKFDRIAYNITDKKIPEPGDEKTYIGLEHLDSGSLKVTRWGNEVELKGQKLVMKKGDLLFGKRNTYLRRAAIAPHDGIFSAHGMIFRPKTEVIDPEYFPFFISSNYFMDAAIRISVGSLSPTVNWKTLKELEFDIPSLEEQKKNAELLKAINDTKEAYQELLLKTDDLVKSQFIEMFGDPIQNDMKWPVEQLSKVAPQYSPKIEVGEKVWLLNLDMVENDTGNIIEKVYVSPDEIGTSTGTFNSEMVLYSKLRPYLNKVVMPDGEGYATKELVPMLPQKNKLRKEFLAALLRGDHFLSYAVHISAGARMPRMPVKVLKEFNCILPPIELQDTFITFMEQGEKSKKELKQAIESTDNLIKSILYSNLEEKKE